MKDYDKETFFPFRLVEEVIDILKAKNCEFVTYSDYNLKLIHPKLDGFSYFREFIDYSLNGKSRIGKLSVLTRWTLMKLIKNKGIFDFLQHESIRKGPVVVLQHDADQQPFKTIDMMKLEEELGVVSSSYFFRKQNLDFDNTYEVNIQTLSELEGKGFEIGYHLNAYERAEYNEDLYQIYLNEDLSFFNENFDLRTFVPHGGNPSKEGKNNDHIAYVKPLRQFSWCYNGKGFWQNESWSDGNIYFENIEDPRIVASRLRKGQRGMFLMHPQYYGNELSPLHDKLPVSKETWWCDLWKF